MSSTDGKRILTKRDLVLERQSSRAWGGDSLGNESITVTDIWESFHFQGTVPMALRSTLLVLSHANTELAKFIITLFQRVTLCNKINEQ